jgi:hypothetical protein
MMAGFFRITLTAMLKTSWIYNSLSDLTGSSNDIKSISIIKARAMIVLARVKTEEVKQK